MSIVIPFGQYRGQTPADVAKDSEGVRYLKWMLDKVQISTGVRFAIVAALRDHGLPIPEPELPPLRPCRRCGSSLVFAYWYEDSLGRRGIRGDCGRCRTMLSHLPQVEPYVSMADANASQTDAAALLDSLLTRGFGVSADGDQLYVVPARELTARDRLAIYTHKAALLALLDGAGTEGDVRLTLRMLAGPVPAVCRLRRLLKALLRGYGMKCLRVEDVPRPTSIEDVMQ